jgi:hypothetical protein
MKYRVDKLNTQTLSWNKTEATHKNIIKNSINPSLQRRKTRMENSRDLQKNQAKFWSFRNTL